MTLKLLAVPALVAGFMAASSSIAQESAIDAFGTACLANADFFEATAGGLTLTADDMARLCGCLGTAFADYPEADIVMLTHDVENTSTPEERTAYGDYTALENKAIEALNTCFVAEGLADASEPADMSTFDTACNASEGLLMVIGGEPEAAAPMRTTLCQCLVTTLGPQVSTADAAILAADLDGTASEESRQAYPGYQALADVARVAFQGCFATIHPAEPAE